ncbi:MAG TPA: type II toxin-antitoxin system VapC family toxin [Sphingomicrobium sp.]|nr:type II toxin-antitoxin system VapC family toxin [Sphingomicrobium sp.]
MILLDTNVVSELMKDAAEPAVEQWFVQNEDETVLPAIALAELSYGVARLEDSRRRRHLQARLTEWRLKYAVRTLAFGPSAAMRYGPMLATVVANGRSMTLADAQIAAMALDEQATVATRNVKDFEPSGTLLVNPWGL